jgi:glycosyltransferase involved in cell wall biosynthesis
MVIHQLSTAFVPGDAIGNQAQAIRAALRSLGMKNSQAYAQYRDARLADRGRDYRRLRLAARDRLIYHHSIGSPVSQVARRYLDRLIFYYHNVTPSQFLRGYNGHLADLLDEGRADVPDFREAPVVWAASEYDRQELLGLGFRTVTVMPLRVDVVMLHQSATSANGLAVLSRYPKKDSQGRDWVNWLFVGRIVPNKRQDALIRAFCYYQRFIQPRSRLFLVGSAIGAPGYQIELESLAASLGIRNVIFAGSPSFAEGFGGYFSAATVFVCASEHEGFCVPIIEAMTFGLPVVALDATGVPCAVGDAGLLVSDNSPATLAEAVNLILTDRKLRDQFAQRQETQVTEHAPAQFEAVLYAQVDPLIQQE